jgi:hypothetical protein
MSILAQHYALIVDPQDGKTPELVPVEEFDQCQRLARSVYENMDCRTVARNDDDPPDIWRYCNAISGHVYDVPAWPATPGGAK